MPRRGVVKIRWCNNAYCNAKGTKHCSNCLLYFCSDTCQRMHHGNNRCDKQDPINSDVDETLQAAFKYVHKKSTRFLKLAHASFISTGERCVVVLTGASHAAFKSFMGGDMTAVSVSLWSKTQLGSVSCLTSAMRLDLERFVVDYDPERDVVVAVILGISFRCGKICDRTDLKREDVLEVQFEDVLDGLEGLGARQQFSERVFTVMIKRGSIHDLEEGRSWFAKTYPDLVNMLVVFVEHGTAFECTLDINRKKSSMTSTLHIQSPVNTLYYTDLRDKKLDPDAGNESGGRDTLVNLTSPVLLRHAIDPQLLRGAAVRVVMEASDNISGDMVGLLAHSWRVIQKTGRGCFVVYFESMDHVNKEPPQAMTLIDCIRVETQAVRLSGVISEADLNSNRMKRAIVETCNPQPEANIGKMVFWKSSSSLLNQIDDPRNPSAECIRSFDPENQFCVVGIVSVRADGSIITVATRFDKDSMSQSPLKGKHTRGFHIAPMWHHGVHSLSQHLFACIVPVGFGSTFSADAKCQLASLLADLDRFWGYHCDSDASLKKHMLELCKLKPDNLEEMLHTCLVALDVMSDTALWTAFQSFFNAFQGLTNFSAALQHYLRSLTEELLQLAHGATITLVKCMCSDGKPFGQCLTCDQRGLMRCKGCGVVQFCSVECQRIAHPEHRDLCRLAGGTSKDMFARQKLPPPDAELLDRSAKAKELKEDGNEALRLTQLSKAVDCYTSAIVVLSSDGKLDWEDNFADLAGTLLCNRSMCLHRLGRHREALSDAIHASSARPEWHKPLYRAGTILLEQGSCDEAVASFSKGLDLCELNSSEYREFSKLLMKARENLSKS